MRKATLKLDKPFGVVVRTNGKTVLKQMESREEVDTFVEQISKFKDVEFEILERPTTGIEGRPYSEAFVRVDTKNVPVGFYYKCVPVRPKHPMLFCTECHDYKNFTKQKDSYGTVFNACPDCGLPDTDFNIKTANSLWPKMPKY